LLSDSENDAKHMNSDRSVPNEFGKGLDPFMVQMVQAKLMERFPDGMCIVHKFELTGHFKMF
jgi:hypothetical protein